MTREAAVAPRPLDLVDWAWRIGTSAYLTIALCLLLALTLAAAALIPQQPDGLSGGAALRWQTATSASYGGLGQALAAVGAFNILGNPGMAALLALLGYHLLLCAAACARRAWHTLRKEPGLPPAGLPPEPLHLAAPLASAAAQVAGVLAAAGYTQPAAVLDAPARAVFYGVRRRWGVVSPLLAYAGGLIFLLGLLINGTAGWTAPELALAPGNVAALPGQEGMQARLQGLEGPDTAPLARVLLSQPDANSAELAASYDRPGTWGNLWLALRSTGPALGVSALDAGGQLVALQGGGQAVKAVNLLFTPTQTEQVFAVPDRNVAFRVVNYPALPGQDVPQAAFLVEAYRGSDLTPALSQLIGGQASLALDGVTYTFRPERHAVMAVAYWPGLWLLAAGGLLLLAGITLAAWRPHGAAWISLVAEGNEVLGLVRVIAWLGSDAEREQLAGLLLAAAAGPEPEAASQPEAVA
jgi:hypothetical protein